MHNIWRNIRAAFGNTAQKAYRSTAFGAGICAALGGELPLRGVSSAFGAGICAALGGGAALAGAERRFRRGNFSPHSAGSCPCGGEVPLSTQEFFAALGGEIAPAGCNAPCLPRREAPARDGALNLISSCAIAVSSIGHSMSLQCEATPSWERGKKKIRTKIDCSRCCP